MKSISPTPVFIDDVHDAIAECSLRAGDAGCAGNLAKRPAAARTTKARALVGERTSRGGPRVKLTNDELTRFEEDGYLFFPGRFTREEAAAKATPLLEPEPAVAGGK